MKDYDSIKKSYEAFLNDWQDIQGPGGFGAYQAGYFDGHKDGAADLAKAREEGRRLRGVIDDMIQVAFDGPREAKGSGCPETAYEWKRRIEKEARDALLEKEDGE